MVLGDFNAYLGRMGVRGIGCQNMQGILVEDVMARCNLNDISLGSLSSGPEHIYIY